MVEMKTTNFAELRKAVLARPGARERIAAAQAEALAEIEEYERRAREG